MTTWLPNAKKFDLSNDRGNGPFKDFRGVILHVNVDEAGTPDSFWANNPGQVCPNFQVYKDGSIHQMLPLNWQPWCQIDGNFNYAAIETAGLPDEQLTPQQVKAIAYILGFYRDELGFKPQLANSPGDFGLGTHKMGGPAWGGHECPGAIRTAQRPAILAALSGPVTKEFTVDAAAAARFDKLDAEVAAVADALAKLAKYEHDVMVSVDPKTGKAGQTSFDTIIARRQGSFLKSLLASIAKLFKGGKA